MDSQIQVRTQLTGKLEQGQSTLTLAGMSLDQLLGMFLGRQVVLEIRTKAYVEEEQP